MANRHNSTELAITFLQDIKNIHGDNLLVLDSYTHSKTKVNILCNICSNTWGITPNDLKAGHGCPTCAQVATNDRVAASFLSTIADIHKDNLIVLSPYISSKAKVECVCIKCYHIWATTPSLLKRGSGCPICARDNNLFNTRKYIEYPITIYYIYFPEYNLWKIGCTKHDATTRFIKDNTKVHEVYSEVIPIGSNAYKLEDYLLRQFREFKYRGPNILRSGNTELLIQEINFKESLEQAKVELGITNVN